ncbi:WD40 repeat-like protein [Coccomyxa subellipsoidea C-169]|uniref:DDB1- and CUL4-associated factor 13 n=1 Tax=Coccomyxa subellipsoidea (strain C-169) TaxID=574566 RepID=I0Z366_COCSC|nr:WD40 repeat-like protein [Coccomyxa subellipsoidea C-169]EIE25085.1 WD40 repeat-like protein [Coccomyxa subellipsoidea C-169]|eukprot:XP_005649629.1 WD40 repeat-like protein [Coccomyxa subellipsoidea C-169]
MKIKTINRSASECTRERSQDVQKVHKNLDPALHPFEKAVEYTRALNAAKLDRVFAKPFISAFPHDDGVTCLARNPKVLNGLAAGCADGIIKLWDVPGKRSLRKLVGHTGAVKGISIAPSGDVAVSCSTDCSVRLFRLPFAPFMSAGPVEDEASATLEFLGKHAFRGIDHHWTRNTFATAGQQVDVWDHERSEPVSTFSWGSDSVTSVRFNPAEPDLLASAGSDRSIALYDLRSSTPIRKIIMQTRSNSIAWNPMEAFNFTCANEDCNLYTYDMRKLKSAACIHKDFVSAVMDVDYSPTGREFVAGSYDRSVRLFAYNGGHSKEVYHTKRMQRVFAVRFSGDGSYVFSGSDDMNVRVWKARASQQQGTMVSRELHKQAYGDALVQRYQHMPEIRRITRHRHLPVPLYKAAKLRRTMTEAEDKKQKRRVAHSKPGSVIVKPARKKRIVAELE